MNFLNRLGYYLIGFSVGIILLAFIFKGKGISFCYMPNCRVLQDIRSKDIAIAEAVALMGGDLERLKPILYNGTVDFSQSQVHTQPCKVYVIEGKLSDGGSARIRVENCNKKATVISLERLK